MELSQKTKGILIGIGLGIFLGLQAMGSAPGVTDQGVPQGSFTKFIGIGAALGFFIGLANLSKANPNPHKVAGFVACLIAGLVALFINLHRGYVSADFGFNIVSLIAIAYVPMLLIGGAASALFSKNV